MPGATQTNAPISVVIAAYTSDRWELLERAVASVANQTVRPTELILCIDHNEDLLARCRERWDSFERIPNLEVKIIPSDDANDEAERTAHQKAHGIKRRFGAGGVRTTATFQAKGDIVAFLDDDAEAAPDWLEQLVRTYESSDVIAVGGAPLPRYETKRPSWMPREFDWVFGCAYSGMPVKVAPIRHLIGANMSARRSELTEIGGFLSVDFDDMDMCHRLAHAFPEGRILYNPYAIVYHFVSAQRVTWKYFWRRCFFVNRHKVRAFAEMGSAANLSSERNFVFRIFGYQLLKHLRDLIGGDVSAGKRILASSIGVGLAVAGHLVGRSELAMQSVKSWVQR